jgi:nucleoside-diphosphate-sugar epimerase
MSASSRRVVFVAGAGGAIGRVLCELLVGDGWRVVGTTRKSTTASALGLLGVDPIVVDVFDRDALVRAVADAAPDVVVHQLTDLPQERTPASMAAARPGNARIREIGTANLVAAAELSSARRLVAQSIAFAYAPGPRPYFEDAALDAAAAPAVVKLEELVLGSTLEGIVLRYGRLYGPRTWSPTQSSEPPAVHVDAAADAARRAMTLGRGGAYNVAEDDGFVSSIKAVEELGWTASFRASGS